MRDSNTIIRERQLVIRRELDRRGVALKAVSFDSGIPYATLLSYFPAPDGERDPAVMPVSALYCLVGAIPDDLLSLLLPAGRVIVQVPDNVDHDALCEAMQAYLAEKAKAHRPESECGPAIGPGEDNVLRGKFTRVRAVAA
jgi:hypothetical protein